MLKFATKGRFLSDEGNPLPLFTFKFYSSSSCYLFHDSCRKDLSRICKLLNTLLCCGKFGYTSDSSYAAVWCLGPKINTPTIAAFSDRQWNGLKGFAMNCFSCNCRCVCNKTFELHTSPEMTLLFYHPHAIFKWNVKLSLVELKS